MVRQKCSGIRRSYLDDTNLVTQKYNINFLIKKKWEVMLIINASTLSVN